MGINLVATMVSNIDIADNLKYLFSDKDVKNPKLLKLEMSCVYEKLEIHFAFKKLESSILSP